MGFAAAATSSAGARTAHLPSAGLGAEQIRVRQASNCCMTSREAGYVPWRVDNTPAKFNSEYNRFGAENYRSRRGGRRQQSQQWKGRQVAVTPLCLIGGLGGSYWDGSDTDSTPSERFLPKKFATSKSAESSVLLSLIQEIEPLDMSLIGKEASPAIMDAMKRTISGMLGLLPSNQFQVTVQTEREPLAKLLVSGMMTGYTLRNAEYRLALQRSLDLPDDVCGVEGTSGGASGSNDEVCEDEIMMMNRSEEFNFLETSKAKQPSLPQHLGELSPEVAEYIQSLQAKLEDKTAELSEARQSYAALEMEMIGEEKNDLLDYLRSLEPTKVAELSKVASPEVEEVVHQVIDGLLGSLTPVRDGGGPAFNAALSGAIASTWKHDDGETTEAVANIPLQFESTVTASRDYVARLLFWCMLLGHYMRGMEYRLDLTRTFSLSSVLPVTSAGSCPSEEMFSGANGHEGSSHVEIMSEVTEDAGNV